MARPEKVAEEVVTAPETKKLTKEQLIKVLDDKIEKHNKNIETLKKTKDEIDGKIQKHLDNIKALEEKKKNLAKPNKKDLSDLLGKVGDMSLEEIAAKLGVSLDK